MMNQTCRACLPICVLTLGVLFALGLLTPAPVVGQQVPMHPAFAGRDVVIHTPDTVSAGTLIGPGYRTVDARSPFETSTALRLTRDDALMTRLMQHASAGALIGGIVGYSLYEGYFKDRNPCNPNDHLFCGLDPIAYTAVGIEVGALAGLVIGYLRARP